MVKYNQTFDLILIVFQEREWFDHIPYQIQGNLRLVEKLGLRAPWDPFFVGKRGRPGVYGTGEMLR